MQGTFRDGGSVRVRGQGRKKSGATLIGRCIDKSGKVYSNLEYVYFRNTWVVWKVRRLNLLLRVGTLWRCGDGLFFEVPPFKSDTLLTALHPLLENVLQTVGNFEISYLGRFTPE
jgi:hypothetical protein